MTQLSEDTVKKAQADQAKYWESLSSNFLFFRKTDVDAKIFDLPCYDGFFDKYKENFEEAVGYLYIGRYWATNYLEHHLNWMWLKDFEQAKSEGVPDKKASALADKNRTDSTKKFKELYP